MYEIIKYDDNAHKNLWNDFLEASEQGLFIFNRQFMSYHAHRFVDNSLLFYEHNKLIALLPANVSEKVLYTHQGLTFGGFIEKTNLLYGQKEKLLAALIDYCKKTQMTGLVYKHLPSFLSADDSFLYLFYAQNAHRTLEANALVDLRRDFLWQERRKRGCKKAAQNGVSILKVTEHHHDYYTRFWAILSENLKKRFDKQPAHNIAEILLLVARFPKHIQLWVALDKEEIIGGSVLLFFRQNVHTQYIAASEAGKSHYALDVLFSQILNYYRPDNHYFSWGISNTRNGNELNAGLLEWKQSWGSAVSLHTIDKLAI